MNITNTYEHAPAGDAAPESLVVLLHGLGSNGQDLISLAPVWARVLPRTVFVSPDAPFPCDMAPGMMNSYQWFSLQDRDPDQILRGVETAAPILERFIQAQLEKYKLPPGKLVLGGFSQGTMMSLYAAPRYKDKIAGVLGYSGALVGGEGLVQDPGAFHKLPIHLIHGEADTVVPVEAYHQAKDTLEKAGFKVSGYTTPNLPHGIDEQGVQSGAFFLKDVLVT